MTACTDASLNKVASKETMENNGWVVDVSFHNTVSNYATCDQSTFYGLKSDTSAAQVVTKFRGTGGAKLEVGNCWNSGFVSILMNDRLITMLRGNSREVIKLTYQTGDVLTIKTVSLQTSAILAIYSFEVTDWGTCFHIYLKL